jgi:penicillin amidase
MRSRWDNVETKKQKGIKIFDFEILQRRIAVLEKQLGKSVPAWTNKVHGRVVSALWKVALLRRIFNVGPFEVSGSNEVINNQMFDYTVKIRSKRRASLDEL